MSLRKQRVLSANLRDHPEKRRRYEKIQTESSQSFHRPVNHSKIRSYSREDSRQVKQAPRQPLIKQPQRVVEQNLNLKQFINDLQQQLVLQRGRLEKNKRKTEKYVKKLNRQFDKELYYSGKNPHSYMFSGIKQQYENVKMLYDQKASELQDFIKIAENSSVEELRIYIEALEEQNMLLKDKLVRYYGGEDGRSHKRLRAGEIKKQKQSKIDQLYTEMDEEEEEEQEEYIKQQPITEGYQRYSNDPALVYLKMKNSEVVKEAAQLKKKVQFLEHLMIEKGNNEHQALRWAKQTEKQKNELVIEIKKLKQEMAKGEQLHNKKLQMLISIERKKFEIESDIFKRSIFQKNEQIVKLEKQIRFLSTMLSYWKPLDEFNRNDIPKDSQKEDYSQSLKVRPNEAIRKESMASSNHLPSEVVAYHSVEHDRSFKSNREEDIIKQTSGARSQSQQNVLNLPKERAPQSCAKKSKSSSKKCRRVEAHEIKQLGQLLRYRLIGNNFSLEGVKALLDLAEDCPYEEKQFRLEYISMREIKNVLREKPFLLSEEEAVLVSRFVVEDQPLQYIYWDQQNQIKRTIAKSIIKTLIGDYQLPNLSQVREEWEKLKAQYLSNIQAALKIIAPKGVISEAKFIELLIGLGIELKDDFKDWIISSMVIESNSLKELNYRSIIPLS